jgi:hypothetical protein
MILARRFREQDESLNNYTIHYILTLMEHKFKYILSTLASALIITSCNETSPTELISSSQNDDVAKIELFSSTPANPTYQNGYDSVGIFSTVDPNYSSVISVSSVKTSNNSKTNEYCLAQAFFFDKDKPVRNHKGEKIGYKAEPPGIVSFDNIPVRKETFRLNFGQGGARKDTAAGYYGVLCSKAAGEGNFTFKYNSKIDFTLKTISSTIKFDIATPAGITGSVAVEGKHTSQSGFNINLAWNKIGDDSVDIVLGAIMQAGEQARPIVHFKAKDSGHLKIPQGILSSLQYDKYKKLVFTFIRKKTTSSNLLKDNYILAQSIHSIKVNIP